MGSKLIGSFFENDISSADALVVGIPFGKTASFGLGSEMGPLKIWEVMEYQIEHYDRYFKAEPCNIFKYGFDMLDVDNLDVYCMVSKVKSYLDVEDRFYVLVGGVHSISIPSFMSLAEKYDPSTITIVQIDAHFDLRQDDSDYNEDNPSIYAHSTVMRRAHELGFNIVSIGVRSMYSHEVLYAAKNGIKYFEGGRPDFPLPEPEKIVNEIETERIYLTIDIDGFDPSVMPATGTPVPGGLTWEYGNALIRTLVEKKTLLSADITEISPDECSSQTEVAVAQLVYEILAINSFKYHAKQTNVSNNVKRNIY